MRSIVTKRRARAFGSVFLEFAGLMLFLVDNARKDPAVQRAIRALRRKAKRL